MQAKAAGRRPEDSEEDEDDEEDVGTCCLTPHRPPHTSQEPKVSDVVSVPHVTRWALALSLESYQLTSLWTLATCCFIRCLFGVNKSQSTWMLRVIPSGLSPAGQ